MSKLFLKVFHEGQLTASQMYDVLGGGDCVNNTCACNVADGFNCLCHTKTFTCGEFPAGGGAECLKKLVVMP
ncbi:MAG: hypothetical protein HDS14_05650 [Bacteroides sp.]|nr:hypothetical protein [Bacteroides sp.]